MKKRRRQNKWVKFQALKCSQHLAAHLPETRKFTRKALWALTNKYGTVMLKPFTGRSGYGIIQFRYLEEQGRYVIRIENRNIVIDGKRAAFHLLKRLIGGQKYMVQRHIPLAELEQRPFDIKVMVQRKKPSAWKVVGMLAVVAEKDYAVTNVSRTILPVMQAIELSLLKPTPAQSLNCIKTICLLAAKQLERHYPSQTIIGFDVALDQKANVWIIEANFKPSKKPFLFMKK